VQAKATAASGQTHSAQHHKKNMDILLLDALVPEAMGWLQERHSVAFRPELVDDLPGLAKAGELTSGVVFPRQTMVTRDLLDRLPQLKVMARLHVASDSTDMDACQTRGIRVIHSSSANVRSNAEFLLATLLLMYRRGVVSAFMGSKYPTTQMGRELSGSTVGILGLAPAAQALAGMLGALGVHLIGYDPAVHSSSPLWAKLGIRPVTLPDLMGKSDAVSVQILYGSRFKGLVGDKLLTHCKPGQVWVGLSRSDLFDPEALAGALKDGRIEAFTLDGVDPDFIGPNSPLYGLKNLFVTPRLGSHTYEARLRSSWYVAHRMHDTLAPIGSDWSQLLTETPAPPDEKKAAHAAEDRSPRPA
jgi:D-3-phosphoglycerate dehydrogenase